MSQQAWRATRPGGVRAYVLLVLAVLVGLVAMHGLGPAVPRALNHAAPDTRHTVTATAPSHACDCVHVDHDSNGDAGGHVEHADATCAAGGTSGAPALPALSPGRVVTCPTADMLATAPATTLGERAPPSLSELQLLRI